MLLGEQQMAFNYTKGPQVTGDLKGRDDAQQDTKIDFEEDEINLITADTTRVKINNNGAEVHGQLYISGSQTELLRISKGDDDLKEIAFENDGVDIGSIYFNSAEHMFIRQEDGSKDLALRIGSTNAIRVDGSESRVGIYTDSPQQTLDVAGGLRVQADSIQITTSKTPASSTDSGQAGQIAWDANYLYICVATNTWKRVNLVNW
jgi:hypothetical protein